MCNVVCGAGVFIFLVRATRARAIVVPIARKGYQDDAEVVRGGTMLIESTRTYQQNETIAQIQVKLIHPKEKVKLELVIDTVFYT